MIYVMQPFWYSKNFYNTVRDILEKDYPNKTIKRKSFCQILPNHKTPNTYFIINDVHLKSWNGLKTAKIIRNKDPKSHLILVSNELDYPKFFRSHLSFLGVLNLKELNKDEIKSYLQDIIGK